MITGFVNCRHPCREVFPRSGVFQCSRGSPCRVCGGIDRRVWSRWRWWSRWLGLGLGLGQWCGPAPGAGLGLGQWCRGAPVVGGATGEAVAGVRVREGCGDFFQGLDRYCWRCPGCRSGLPKYRSPNFPQGDLGPMPPSSYHCYPPPSWVWAGAHLHRAVLVVVPVVLALVVLVGDSSCCPPPRK